MPIFHDPETSTTPPSKPANSEIGNIRNHSADSRWKKDQIKEIDSESSPQNSSTYDYHLLTPRSRSREELIQSIKRGESPTWAHRDVGIKPTDQAARSKFSQELEKNCDSTSDKDNVRLDIPDVDERSELAKPSEIERPRSALHSGDFREGAAQNQETKFPDFGEYNSSPHPPSFKRYGSSPTTPWFNHAASARHISTNPEASPLTGQHIRSVLGARSRAPSLGSFSSSYVLKAPTSPLVHQANNTDLDFSTKRESTDDLAKSIKNSRRRTLPPETFMQLRGSPPNQSRNFNLSRSFASAHGSEESRLQAYQPHRSSFYSLQPASSSPQTPFRFRRPSFASDSSPRIHASMVGSYEESILRGRMSTTPSQPLDFTAQIGVLGRGKCKSNLRCPPHITVPFPAVFYSYPTSGHGRSISDDSPSPYVGLIDLQNAQPRDGGSEKKRSRQKKPVYENSGSSTPIPSPDCGQRQRREKRSSRSDAAKAPPGGSYRIPQRGQLQIVIKNPNKTAVKLFLVPYDLDDMEQGTKTFIRQRSYSAGPIIDMPLTARKNLGTDRPEASLNPTSDPKDKPTLRYLIHLNICCPSKGRFYLHSTIRVVFANRVPDGKEKLRNEIQHPEPRYSPYKPVKDSNYTSSNTSAIDKSHRRRSAGIGFTGSQFFDDKFYPDSPSAPSNHKQVQPVPFRLNIPNPQGSSAEDTGPSLFSNNDIWQTGNASTTRPISDEMSIDSPPPPKSADLCNFAADDAEMSNNDSEYYGNYHQLATSPTSYSSVGESLLAQRLREWSCSNEQNSDSQE